MVPSRASLSAALLGLASLLYGCDSEPEEQADGSVSPSLMDAGLMRPTSYQATLTPAADAAVYISVPHTVSLLDNLGNALIPPVETTSGPQGQVELPLPPEAASLYVVGVGPVEDESSTYDTVVVNENWSSGSKLLRISDRRTLRLALQGADFTPRSDRASLRGTVYWSTNGLRRGTVGCAKVYIDGATQPDTDQVQRYGSLLPVPLDKQSQTNRGGTFYFGNIKVGLHSLRVSLDDGATFLPSQSFSVGRTRAGAQSPIKAVLYQYGFDIEATADPTPESCPL